MNSHQVQAAATVASVIAMFATSGWKVDADWQCTGTKPYETAVGPKEAIVYARVGREGGIVIEGEYQSEGRNALSTCWGRVPDKAEESVQMAAVDRWIAEADKAVAGTYAARLLSGRKETH